ncbi:MAG TPA: GTPase [Actinocatenispora sp.]
MIRPDSAARRDAEDSGADVQAWIQQLASDDPIGPPDDESAPAGADANESGTSSQPGMADEVSADPAPRRRGWRGLRTGRRRADEPVPADEPNAPDATVADDTDEPAATDPSTDDTAGTDARVPATHHAPPGEPAAARHAPPGEPVAARRAAPGAPQDPVTEGRPGTQRTAPDEPTESRRDEPTEAGHGKPTGARRAGFGVPEGKRRATSGRRHLAPGEAVKPSDEPAQRATSDEPATEETQHATTGEPEAQAGDGRADPLAVPRRHGRPADSPSSAKAPADLAVEATRGRHLDAPPERDAPTDSDARGNGDARGGGDARGAAVRLAALAEFVAATEDSVPADRLAPARELIGRAGERLELSDRHTVVVLAGTTGSGKSSLFNALSGLDLSRVGVRRPTTAELHGCVWDPDGAPELLDWLGVPERRRTVRESVLDGDAQKALRGLILLDLPDFDSVEEAHRAEVDRLVGVVDLVIWVVDPQKYADRTLHEKYLSPLVARAASTAVVLNQADRLSAVDADRCAEDLGRLLVEDGLGSVPLHLTSARTGAGVAELRTVLAGAVRDRRAAARRVAADLDVVAADLTDLAPPDADDALAVEERAGAGLPDRVAELAGVPGLLDVAEQDYRRRARRATGWLFVRWAFGGRNVRRQLEQERYDLDWLDDPASRTAEKPAAAPAGGQRRFGLAGVLRGYLDAVAGHLPAAWLGAARTAVATQAPGLVDRLSRLTAIATRPVRPGWWLAVTVVQWVFGGCAVVGAVGLVAAAFGYAPLPVALPLLLLLGGLALGVLLAVAAVPLVRAGAREHRRATEMQLRSAVVAAATSCVREPVRAELTAYERARATLRTVRSGR